MGNLYTHIMLFFIPLICGNICHMFVVKNNWLSKLNTPISIFLFGLNKTYRGAVVLPLITGVIALIDSILFGPFETTSLYDFFVGLGLGMAYILSELPNSFIKRRLGIGNGQQSKKYSFVQVIADKADSLIGVLLFYYCVITISFNAILLLFLVSIIIHIGLSHFLVLIKIKKAF
jgi:hypothetical protein